MTNFYLNPLGISQKSFYGKAVVKVLDDGSRILQSYNTDVCSLTPSGALLRHWDGYSATTIKHVDSFLKLYNMGSMNKHKWENWPITENKGGL